MYKIMIVDDNKTNLIMAKKALEDTYDVIPMSSGLMAIEFLKEMPEPPDILLLDVDMPDINGFLIMVEGLPNEGLQIPDVEVGGHVALYGRAVHNAPLVLLVILLQQFGHAAVPNGKVGGVFALQVNLLVNVYIDGVKAVVVALDFLFIAFQRRGNLLRRLLCEGCCHD